jgi:NAD(P)-dependent dehydrogenase (short-subunit alcohol dehydrogenase family)
MSAASARRFEGRVALVTGGASGIGRAVATRLGAEGARVVIADIDVEGGERVAAADDAVTFIRTDVSQGDEVERLVATIVERFGRLDAVHANAGIETPPLLLADTPDEWFDRAIAVNTRGIFLTCKHAIRHMLERGEGGAIVCTSSILDPGAFAKIAVYSISKAAVGAIVRAIAVEYATHGIRANAVLPGATETPLVEREIADSQDPVTQRKMIEGLQMMKRLGQPSEIAAAVAFLLSDDASFMTGASVPVDGGCLAALPGPDVLTAEELGTYWTRQPLTTTRSGR